MSFVLNEIFGRRLQIKINRFPHICDGFLSGAALGPATPQGRAVSGEISIFTALDYDFEDHRGWSLGMKGSFFKVAVDQDKQRAGAPCSLVRLPAGG